MTILESKVRDAKPTREAAVESAKRDRECAEELRLSLNEGKEYTGRNAERIPASAHSVEPDQETTSSDAA